MKASHILIDSSVQDDTATLRVSGDTTARDRVAAFHKVVADLVQRGARNVVVDLSTTRWIGAAMLGELVAALNTVKRSGGRMQLSGLPRSTHRILALTRLDTIFETTDAVSA